MPKLLMYVVRTVIERGEKTTTTKNKTRKPVATNGSLACSCGGGFLLGLIWEKRIFNYKPIHPGVKYSALLT